MTGDGRTQMAVLVKIMERSITRRLPVLVWVRTASTAVDMRAPSTGLWWHSWSANWPHDLAQCPEH